MRMRWTEDQQKVIESRDCSILVSAAAGSGKTAVLTARILSKITDPDHPLDVDRLLVVTFTNAAAAQMRERIGRAIEERLQADPANIHLQRQSALLDNACITTIDSFCLQVVRSHYHAVDLDPSFAIGDPDVLDLMRDEACEAALERFHERFDGAKDFTGEPSDPSEASASAGNPANAGFTEGLSDPTEASVLQGEAAVASAFAAFYQNYATAKSDAGIRAMILKMYDFSQSHEDPQGWLRGCADAYRVSDTSDLYAQEWMQLLLQYLDTSLSYMTERYRALAARCEQLETPDACRGIILSDLEQAERFAACRELDAYYREAQALSFARWSIRKRSAHDAPLLDAMKQERDTLKKELQTMCKQFFSQPETDVKEMIRYTGRMVQVLVDLTLEFTQQFRLLKRLRNMADFSDLEHYALRILLDDKTGEPTEAAREYRERFEEVMVDEYQDSNYVQEALLKAVSGLSAGRENYFMVGDVKQSIYRFRLARPELFIEKYKTFTPEGGAQRRIDLHANFRSRPEIIRFVNHIFHQTMRSDIGNIEYDAAAALRAGAVYEEDPDGRYRPELLLLRTDAAAREAGEQEAYLTAGRIRTLLDEDPSLSYKDIVILMRSPGGRAAVYQEVLTECGIPVTVESQTGFFAAREVELALNFLRLIDNPLSDIPLASVLTSYPAELTAEDLAIVKAAYPQLPFHEAVFAYAGAKMQEDSDASGQDEKGESRNGQRPDALARRLDPAADRNVREADAGPDREDTQEEKLRERLRAFINLLDSFRARVPYAAAHRLLEAFYRETGFYHYAGALPAGRQRQANLDRLFEIAVSYEKAGGGGLHDFCRYIDRLLKRGTDYGEASLFSGKEDAVRIMSIHKSKGLEFPVVFLNGLGNAFNTTDVNSNVVFHPDLGCGLKYVDRKRHIKADTLIRRAMAVALKKESLGEELRVLYVAMTRAEKKLIMTGRVPAGFALNEDAAAPDTDGQSRSREENGLLFDLAEESGGMDFYLRFHAKSYLDFILPSLNGADCSCRLADAKNLQMRASARAAADEAGKKGFLRRVSVREEEAYCRLDAVFAQTYAYAGEDLPKQRVSVSEIKHRAMEAYYDDSGEEPGESLFAREEPLPYIPAFIQARGENRGALYGTAVHEFLRHFDYGRLPAQQADTGMLCGIIEAEIARMVSEGRLEDTSGASLNRDSLLAFFCSKEAQRIRRADARGDAFREQPFTMSVDAARVWPDAGRGQEILTQGIIDIFWLEEDGIVLLDYKTDRVKQPQELIGRYRAQLLIYAEALTRFYPDRPVKEILLYSFRLNCTIPVAR